MIFTTFKERDRVYEIIRRRDLFEDLMTEQNITINGMYAAISRIEEKRDAYEDKSEDLTETLIERMASEVALIACDEIVRDLEDEIACLYVGFCEMNAED